jgi:hypothetical protein
LPDRKTGGSGDETKDEDKYEDKYADRAGWRWPPPRPAYRPGLDYSAATRFIAA